MSEQQLITLLQPLGGQLPSTLQQYRDLMLRIRRMSHIIEGTPFKIGASLCGRQKDRNDGQHFADANQYFFGSIDNANAPSSSPSVGIFPASAQPAASDNQWAQPTQPTNVQGAAAPTTQWSNPADYDSGTDTDTSSHNGNTAYTLEDIPATSSEAELMSHVYWAYSKAKGRRRRMTGKPVRRVR